MKFNDKVYDTLKWIAMFFLPALALFIQSLCAIWGLPYGEQIAATVVALNAFIGACLGISNYNYKKGVPDES